MLRESSAAYGADHGDGRDGAEGGKRSNGANASNGANTSNGATASDCNNGASGGSDLGVPDATAVHELIKSLHQVGNEVRLELLDALIVLYEGKLYVELGYSSVHQYSDRELGLRCSTAYEYVRAGIALAELLRLRAMFKEGSVSWQQVRAITRVATPDTEIAWIELALEAPMRELIAEVREAQRTGRSAPRERRHGLPNLLVRVSFQMTLEEKQRVMAAFAQVSEALDDGNASTSGRPALVRWADGILSGAIPATPIPATPIPAKAISATAIPAALVSTDTGDDAAVDAGGDAGGDTGGDAGGNVAGDTAGDVAGDAGVGHGARGAARRPKPAQTIVYHCCPECREATVETEDGLVRVSPERVAELAPDANTVTIGPEEELIAETLPAGQTDAPNSSRLARQVLSRDGQRCQNPGCDGWRNLHAHHIVYRSEGGPTVLSNEVTVCERCHALIHAGLLEVTGRPGQGLTWTPRPVDPGAKVRDAKALQHRLRELARTIPPAPRSAAHLASLSARLRAESTAGDYSPRTNGTSRAAGDSTAVESNPQLQDLAEGIRRLGCPRADSVRLVEAAMEELIQAGNDAPGDEDILRRALQNWGAR